MSQNTPTALDVVIMAAGKGTRMKSRRPKVLQDLAGRPLVQHVIHTAAQLQARMAVVITGASGFVGQHLTRALQARGELVQGWSRGDDAAHTFAGADVVVHLAARVHVMAEASADPLREFRQANVITTEWLARAAAAAG